jgi:hypothetical protein
MPRNDLIISLIVITATGLVIAYIFFAMHQRRQKQERALESFCRDNGYVLRRQTSALAERMTVETSRWRLTSERVARQNESQSGESGWACHSEWESIVQTDHRPQFCLGIVPTSLDEAKIPQVIRQGILQKLREEFQIPLDMTTKEIYRDLGAVKYLLFIGQDEHPNALVAALEPHLLTWPAEKMLVIRSGDSGVRVELKRDDVANVELLRKVIALGEACESFNRGTARP